MQENYASNLCHQIMSANCHCFLHHIIFEVGYVLSYEGLENRAKRCFLVVNNFDIQNLFTRGSHHSNVSVVFPSQNMYYQGRCGKTIRNKVMYWVVFNKSCDLLQLSTLGSRYGIKPALMYAIDDNQYTMYAYILIDLCPTNVSKIKVLTGIFPHELRIWYF